MLQICNKFEEENPVESVVFSSFLFSKKTALCCHWRCLSVRPSVRLSIARRKNTLERGSTITNKPIGLKFDTNIGGRVMHV